MSSPDRGICSSRRLGCCPVRLIDRAALFLRRVCPVNDDFSTTGDKGDSQLLSIQGDELLVSMKRLREFGTAWFFLRLALSDSGDVEHNSSGYQSKRRAGSSPLVENKAVLSGLTPLTQWPQSICILDHV
jgi:hypothetical protein